MDQLAFPPQGLDLESNEKYHQAIKSHSEKLVSLSKESKINFSLALKALDPAQNSISFLAMLVFAADNPKEVPPSELGDHIIRFLVSFDPRQVRYGGPAFMNLCTHILTPTLVPSAIGIDAVATALQKLDPSGSVLTPAHIYLVETAVRTNDVESHNLLAVIGKNILFYPGMLNQVPRGTIPADMSLPPPHFMHGNSGLIAPLKATEVILYEFQCGNIHVMRQDWQSAYDSFLRCATHPSKDGGVSQIMVYAYKRLALVSLLLTGRAAKLPPYSGQSANRVYEIMGKPYSTFASLFEAPNDAAGLIKHAHDWNQSFEQDQNTGLVIECLRAYQKWKIIDLREVYTKMFISEVREQTKSGQTGEETESDAEVEELVRDMISSGMLRGRLSTTDDGWSYLEFLPEQPVLSEKQYQEQLLASAQRVKAVEPLWKIADDRLTTTKEYVRHLVKSEANSKKRGPMAGLVPGTGLDQDESFEDEDLMADSF